MKLWVAAVALGLAGVCAWACGAPQVPPGPAPEYVRPAEPEWDAGPEVDPLAAIEAEGEWVDDEPSGAAGASTRPAGEPASPDHPGRE